MDAEVAEIARRSRARARLLRVRVRVLLCGVSRFARGTLRPRPRVADDGCIRFPNAPHLHPHSPSPCVPSQVPVWRSSPDDILRRIDWLRDNDAAAARVAANGQDFACTHLTRPGRLCYWRRAIQTYARLFQAYTPQLSRRPRAFPLRRLNIMCRVHDGPTVCYYNIKPHGPPIPPGYVCEKPVPGVNGSFEECHYRGTAAPATLHGS